MINKSYNKLKVITDSVYAGIKDKWAKDVVEILQKYNIRLRQKDGRLYSVNVSIPKSRDSCILVGLRYIKKDNSYTEDHFLFEKDRSIVPFYKGHLEDVLPEYKGSHKQQIV